MNDMIRSTSRTFQAASKAWRRSTVMDVDVLVLIGSFLWWWWPGSHLAPAAPRVDCDCEQDDQALGDVLVKRVDLEKVEAVADEGEEQHAQDGAPHGAPAAHYAGAADD